MSVRQHQEEAHANTDEALADIDGLISAIDIILYQDGYTLNSSQASKAVHAALRMMEVKMKEVEALRSAEWRAIGAGCDARGSGQSRHDASCRG